MIGIMAKYIYTFFLAMFYMNILISNDFSLFKIVLFIFLIHLF